MSHYLTGVACDHADDKDCDGPDYCPGVLDDFPLIECECDENASCRWACDVCAEVDGEWAYSGGGTCWHGHDMRRTDCGVIEWFGDTGEGIFDVVNEPRVGRHQIDVEWDYGYRLSYTGGAK